MLASVCSAYHFLPYSIAVSLSPRLTISIMSTQRASHSSELPIRTSRLRHSPHHDRRRLTSRTLNPATTPWREENKDVSDRAAS